MSTKKLLVMYVFCLPMILAAQAPVLFEPGLISTHGQFGLSISPDGNHAAWVHSNGGRDTIFLMESKKVKGRWSKPVAMSFSAKEGWKDIDPMFTPDGSQLIFQSTRPVPGKPERKGFDIWAVKKSGDQFGEPYHLGNMLNTDSSESFASVAKDGSMYFMKANEQGIGNSDIYTAEFSDGSYQAPVNFGKPVNTTFRESNPFISPDEDYLIYFSDDSTGFGEVDLYVTFKQQGRWTIPQNLGGSINTATAEFCPFVHKGEDRLYFARHTRNAKRFIEDIFYYENASALLAKLKQTAKLP
ncbi:MAG: hypothetical protein Q7T76_19800 [Ferruginibacter sp.]|nr:hypothetical protein [Ferruginibacter sp.]